MAESTDTGNSAKKTQRMLSPLSFKITAPYFPAKKRIKRAA